MNVLTNIWECVILSKSRWKYLKISEIMYKYVGVHDGIYRNMRFIKNISVCDSM